MKPIEAQVCYKKKVYVDGEPKMDNGNQVYEDVIADGILYDIKVMREKEKDKEMDDAYALFFEDKKKYFTPSIEMLRDIRILPRKMWEHVKSYYAK